MEELKECRKSTRGPAEEDRQVPTRLGHPAIDSLLTRLAQTRAMYKVLFQANVDVRGLVKDSKLDEHQMTDAALLLKRIAELADDIRKECDSTLGILENATCAIWMHKSMIDSSTAGDIKGFIAQGIPELKMRATLPHRSSPEHSLLMQSLGLPAGRESMFHLHWPAYCEFLQKLAEEGKPAPPGQDPSKMNPRYVLKLRVRSGVSLDDMIEQEDKRRGK